jgi:hypothetical protein
VYIRLLHHYTPHMLAKVAKIKKVARNSLKFMGYWKFPN